jgi:hypothetical protein
MQCREVRSYPFYACIRRLKGSVSEDGHAKVVGHRLCLNASRVESCTCGVTDDKDVSFPKDLSTFTP